MTNNNDDASATPAPVLRPSIAKHLTPSHHRAGTVLGVGIMDLIRSTDDVEIIDFIAVPVGRHILQDIFFNLDMYADGAVDFRLVDDSGRSVTVTVRSMRQGVEG